MGVQGGLFFLHQEEVQEKNFSTFLCRRDGDDEKFLRMFLGVHFVPKHTVKNPQMAIAVVEGKHGRKNSFLSHDISPENLHDTFLAFSHFSSVVIVLNHLFPRGKISILPSEKWLKNYVKYSPERVRRDLSNEWWETRWNYQVKDDDFFSL